MLKKSSYKFITLFGNVFSTLPSSFWPGSFWHTFHSLACVILLAGNFFSLTVQARWRSLITYSHHCCGIYFAAVMSFSEHFLLQVGKPNSNETKIITVSKFWSLLSFRNWIMGTAFRNKFPVWLHLIFCCLHSQISHGNLRQPWVSIFPKSNLVIIEHVILYTHIQISIWLTYSKQCHMLVLWLSSEIKSAMLWKGSPKSSI